MEGIGSTGGGPLREGEERGLARRGGSRHPKKLKNRHFSSLFVTLRTPQNAIFR
jgi:hypothetical protein